MGQGKRGDKGQGLGGRGYGDTGCFWIAVCVCAAVCMHLCVYHLPLTQVDPCQEDLVDPSLQNCQAEKQRREIRNIMNLE